MDAEDCEAFTDVYWIKFLQVNSARCIRFSPVYISFGMNMQYTFSHVIHSLKFSTLDWDY